MTTYFDTREAAVEFAKGFVVAYVCRDLVGWKVVW